MTSSLHFLYPQTSHSYRDEWPLPSIFSIPKHHIRTVTSDLSPPFSLSTNITFIPWRVTSSLHFLYPQTSHSYRDEWPLPSIFSIHKHHIHTVTSNLFPPFSLCTNITSIPWRETSSLHFFLSTNITFIPWRVTSSLHFFYPQTSHSYRDEWPLPSIFYIHKHHIHTVTSNLFPPFSLSTNITSVPWRVTSSLHFFLSTNITFVPWRVTSSLHFFYPQTSHSYRDK